MWREAFIDKETILISSIARVIDLSIRILSSFQLGKHESRSSGHTIGKIPKITSM